MTNAREIEEAVKKLLNEALTRFREWFAAFDTNAWDAQIEADAAAGKLDQLAEEAAQDLQGGKARQI